MTGAQQSLLEHDPMDLALELYRAQAGGDRDYVLFKLAVELVNDLRAYCPSRYGLRPEELLGINDDVLREEIARHSETRPSAVALAFGSWRALITEYEGDDAQRLGVLVSTCRSIEALRVRTQDPETLARLNRMHRELVEHMRFRWRVVRPDARADVRTWAIVSTRQYALLPKTWRYM